MIPKILKIKGLYSYREEQVIDFSKLTKAGLFGIFGDVGSGKSTILEAMIFCIYGKSERLKQSGENRNYNMMNLLMNESEIDFTFIAGPSQQEFNIHLKFGRNKNNFDEVTLRPQQYYRIESGKKVPIDQQEILDAVGLSYENFKMTVIIPQGKFREFIELTNADRSKMLKELFRLHDFDLSSRVKKIEQENDSLLDQKSGEISAYQFEDQDKIVIKEQTLTTLMEELKILSEDLKNLELVVQESKDLKTLMEMLQKNLEEIESLLKDSGPMQELEKELVEYIHIRNEFRQLYEEEYMIKKRLQENRSKSEKFLDQKAIINKSLKALQSTFENVSKKFNEIDRLKTEGDEFEKLATYVEHSNQESICKGELSTIQSSMELITKSIEEKIILKNSLESNIAETRKLILPEHVIFDVRQWFIDEEKSRKLVDELYDKVEDLQVKLNESEENFQKSAEDIQALKNCKNTQEVDAVFQRLVKVLSQELNELLGVKTAVGIKLELSRHANLLEEGKPCMLCGSTHHPIPLMEEISVDDLNILENNINKIQQDINHHWEKCNEFKGKLMEHIQLEQLIAATQQSFEERKSEWQKEFEKIPHEIYAFKDKEDFNAKVKDNILRLESLSDLETKLQSINDAINELNKKQVDFQINEVKWKTDLQNAQSNMNQIKNEIQQIDVKTYLHEDSITLRGRKASILLEINQITQDYNTLKDQIGNKENERSILDGSLSVVMESIIQDEKAFEEAKEKINSKLTEKALNYDQVFTILTKKLDEETLKKQIDSYQKSISNKNSEIEVLKIKIGGRVFDPAQLNEKENLLNQKKVKQKELLEQKGGLATEIEQSKKNLKKKQALQADIDTLQIRKSDIGKLKSMFAGNGFVDFVSKRYLSNVVAIANQRFRKMVRQKYSLELKDGEIIIRDHMNEGKERSIKSLSGGQSFQAALCLALSLSESIQRNAGVDQHFFFLDEGFGSLDEDNLEIVFETLRGLQKENRIVGLISHAKSLQQELDIHLMVTNDEQYGSRILNSWNN